ncbi:Rv3235 family protein [Kitasatospora sp. NBC_00085]|uniref:Rv3235 family protein n=1 Tax=unclassified Kitasatospora TaxID=2633591 RepID=UPI00324AB9B4
MTARPTPTGPVPTGPAPAGPVPGGPADPHHAARTGPPSARPHHPHPTARACHRPPAGRRPRHPRAACTTAGSSPTAPGLRSGLSTRFAHQLVEVLTGARPSGQLMRHTSLDGYGQLAALVRAGTLRRGGAAGRPRLGPVHDRAPSPDVVEACVRVDLGSRHHMVAFRLELRGPAGQWQCTAVEAR